MTNRWWLGAMCLVGCLSPVSETTPTVEVPSCIPGRVEECPCLGQRTGVQKCLADGTFDECVCDTSTTGGGDGASSTGGGTGHTTGGGYVSGGGGGHVTGGGFGGGAPTGGNGGGGNVIVPLDGGIVLSAGIDTLIDLFPVQNGLIVVRSTGVQLLDTQGAQVTWVASPREITSAAFDGTLLGVADLAILTVYDVQLNALRSASLVESCASSVVLSGGRFVCGPPGDWDRVFAVFDMNTGTMLTNGPGQFTYDGIPMRRVPGTDDFVTVTVDLSPSDFTLFRVATDNTVHSYGDSPYHGAFSANTSFAFDGLPPTHLINDTGEMLKIYTSNCAETYSTGNCFARDGQLGVLPNGRAFLSMTEGPPGTIYGISQVTPNTSYFDARCSGMGGCSIDRIDVGARVIRGRTTWTGDVAKVIALRFDSWRQRVVMGFQKPGANYDDPGTWEIVSFAP